MGKTTMPERMATVETKVTAIEIVVEKIDGKVDQLLDWKSEERGAKSQRALSMKQMVAIFTIIGVIVNFGLRFVP